MGAVVERRGLIFVLALALVARLAALALLGAGLERDPDGYWELAASLAEQHVFGYQVAEAGATVKFPLTAERDAAPTPPKGEASHVAPTAFRPPLYPLALAALTGGQRRTMRLAAFQTICGLVTVWLTWRLAGALGLSEKQGLIAATIVAVDPILLAQTAQVMTECFAAMLAVAALYSLTWAESSDDDSAPSSTLWPTEFGPMALAGATSAAAALCRPTFLLWLLLVGAGLLRRVVSPPQTQRGRSTIICLVFCAAAAAVFSPWIARNALVFGRPIVSTTHGGYTMLLGNNRDYYDFLRAHPWSGAWGAEKLQAELERAEAAAGANDELTRDQLATRLALEAIHEQPAMFLAASVKRLSRLWGWLPEQLAADESPARRAARYGSALVLACELILAVAGVWRLGRKLATPPWLNLTLMVLAFTATHAVFWTDLRMRAPLAPGIALLAAAAIPAAASRQSHKPL